MHFNMPIQDMTRQELDQLEVTFLRHEQHVCTEYDIPYDALERTEHIVEDELARQTEAFDLACRHGELGLEQQFLRGADEETLDFMRRILDNPSWVRRLLVDFASGKITEAAFHGAFDLLSEITLLNPCR